MKVGTFIGDLALLATFVLFLVVLFDIMVCLDYSKYLRKPWYVVAIGTTVCYLLFYTLQTLNWVPDRSRLKYQ